MMLAGIAASGYTPALAAGPATRDTRTGCTAENRITPCAGIVRNVTRNLNPDVSYAGSVAPQAPPVGRRCADGTGDDGNPRTVFATLRHGFQ